MFISAVEESPYYTAWKGFHRNMNSRDKEKGLGILHLLSSFRGRFRRDDIGESKCEVLDAFTGK